VRYPKAEHDALSGLNLQIARGAFYGLLGPNGAGKTTLISFLCGQVNGNYQRAQVLGIDRRDIDQYKRRIGYAPQEIALYPTLSGRENLQFFARLLGVDPRGEVDRALHWVGLTDRDGHTVAEYSGGMKRRLNLAVALLQRPEILILDEPTVGVDPQTRQFIFEKILELKKDGVTLLYCTHYLEEVKRLCDNVGILREGKLVKSGSFEEIFGMGNLESRFLDLTEGLGVR
jgi:ABC-2 type transport system ATP-binding protein